MRFLIAVIDHEGNPGSAAEMVAIDALNDSLESKGQLIMACGITALKEATVIDNRAGAGVFADGPLHDTQEYMSGFWLIHAKDLAEAKLIAAEGSKACNRKVELRQLHG